MPGHFLPIRQNYLRLTRCVLLFVVFNSCSLTDSCPALCSLEGILRSRGRTGRRFHPHRHETPCFMPGPAAACTPPTTGSYEMGKNPLFSSKKRTYVTLPLPQMIPSGTKTHISTMSSPKIPPMKIFWVRGLASGTKKAAKKKGM